ncbi:MAG: hypothetical protein JWP10_294 [Nocardioidaceae bacterium]|nr:hypothetical protein [Nocardioidaceae bacterium]
MEPQIRLIDVRAEPLSLDEVFASVQDDRAGAVCVFTGIVRNHDQGEAVKALSYSAHPLAAVRLREVAAEVGAAHHVIALSAVHRVADLQVGDLAVVVAVSAAHRADAFEACRSMIDRLKREVPIWKEQSFASGQIEWVGA